MGWKKEQNEEVQSLIPEGIKIVFKITFLKVI